MEPPRPDAKKGLMIAGSIIRIVGAVLGGVSLIMLGMWLSDPMAMLTNPLAPFQSLGTIVIVAGVSVIFTGVGWSLQTWARGT